MLPIPEAVRAVGALGGVESAVGPVGGLISVLDSEIDPVPEHETRIGERIRSRAKK